MMRSFLPRFLFWLIVFLLALVFAFQSSTSPYFAFDVLTGHAGATDLVQDIVGYRELVAHGNAYAPRGVQAQALGFSGGETEQGTHPPTTFLFTAPIAYFSWSLAAALWAWAMLALFALGLYLLGLGWRDALLWTIAGLFWPPLIGALQNVTVIWFVALVAAWRWREKAVVCGALIALASLTKFFPALLLLAPLIEYPDRRSRLRLLIGFLAVWLLALVWVGALNADAVGQYLSASATAFYITASVNGALLPRLYTSFGLWGVGFGLVLIVFVCYAARADLWMALVFASVALLPITWLYSLVPLVFVWYRLRRYRAVWFAILFPAAPISILATALLILYSAYARFPRPRLASSASNAAS